MFQSTAEETNKTSNGHEAYTKTIQLLISVITSVMCAAGLSVDCLSTLMDSGKTAAMCKTLITGFTFSCLQKLCDFPYIRWKCSGLCSHYTNNILESVPILFFRTYSKSHCRFTQNQHNQLQRRFCMLVQFYLSMFCRKEQKHSQVFMYSSVSRVTAYASTLLHMFSSKGTCTTNQ